MLKIYRIYTNKSTYYTIRIEILCICDLSDVKYPTIHSKLLLAFVFSSLAFSFAIAFSSDFFPQRFLLFCYTFCFVCYFLLFLLYYFYSLFVLFFFYCLHMRILATIFNIHREQWTSACEFFTQIYI